MKTQVKISLLALAIASLGAFTAQEAQAGRFFARGANGAAGGYATAGQYGGRIGGAVLGPNQGVGGSASKWAGPNGGNFQRAGGFGYKRGVGAQRQAGWNGNLANGASGSGYERNQYNAQTGQGVRSSSEQLQNAAGQKYGYNGTTDYTKGQGATSVIQTDNKGTYDINWQKGQKPVVTDVPAN